MSPRPVRFRKVFSEPSTTFFKPAGVPMSTLQEVVLTVDELESVRLKDHEGIGQVEAAEKMGISQPTFQRIYNSARKKIADAIVNGKALRIQGGHYEIHGNAGRGRN